MKANLPAGPVRMACAEALGLLMSTEKGARPEAGIPGDSPSVRRLLAMESLADAADLGGLGSPGMNLVTINLREWKLIREHYHALRFVKMEVETN